MLHCKLTLTAHLTVIQHKRTRFYIERWHTKITHVSDNYTGKGEYYDNYFITIG